MVLSKDVPMGGVCINGMFVYTTKRNPMAEGHTKTEAYVDGRRRSGVRFCAKGSQSPFFRGGSSAQTAQLQSLSFKSALKANAIRDGDFRGNSFICVEKSRGRWGLLNPLYGLAKSSKKWYETLKEAPVTDLG